jgi:hypothetical protein
MNNNDDDSKRLRAEISSARAILEAKLEPLGFKFLGENNYYVQVCSKTDEDASCGVSIGEGRSYNGSYFRRGNGKLSVTVHTGRQVTYSAETTEKLNWKAIINRITTAANNRAAQFKASREQIAEAESRRKAQIAVGIPAPSWDSDIRAELKPDGKYKLVVSIDSATEQQVKAVFAIFKNE